MQTYSSHVPTCFDSHIRLDDREHWLLAPVSQTRDSGPLDLSNFQSCLDSLGGESDTVEVHRFGHWGPGWYEIIIVDPADSDRVRILEDTSTALENYPVLDDSDFSEREHEDYLETWNCSGWKDFCQALRNELSLSDTTYDFLTDLDCDTLLSLFESLITSGDYARHESDGCSIRTEYAAQRCTRDGLASFLRAQRNA